MSAWLAVLLIAIVVAAVAGMVPLRRYADREWREHLRRQQIAAMPEFQRIVKGLVEFKIAVRDQMTPALVRAMAAVADLTVALGGKFPPRPCWKRVLDRLYVGRWIA